MERAQVSKVFLEIKKSPPCAAGGDGLVSEVKGLVSLFSEIQMGRSPEPDQFQAFSPFYKEILMKATNLFFEDVVEPVAASAGLSGSIASAFGTRRRVRGSEALHVLIARVERTWSNPKADRQPALLKPLKLLRFALNAEDHAIFSKLMVSLASKPKAGMKMILGHVMTPIENGETEEGSADAISGKTGPVSLEQVLAGSSSSSTPAKGVEKVMDLDTPVAVPKGVKSKAASDKADDLRAKLAKSFLPRPKR